MPGDLGTRLVEDLGYTKDHILSPTALHSPLLSMLAGYWGGFTQSAGRFPALSEIPEQILRSVRRFMTISRILAPDGTVAYPVAAPACEALDGAFQGKHLDETGWDAPSLAIIRRQHRELMSTQRPVFGEDYFFHDLPARSVFEVGILPLRAGAGALGECLIVRDYQSKRPILSSDAITSPDEAVRVHDLDMLLGFTQSAAALIDGKARILWANDLARRLAEASPSLAINGVLTIASSLDRAAVRNFCVAPAGAGSPGLVIEVELSGGRAGYAILIRCREGRQGAAPGGNAGLFALFLIDPQREIAFPISLGRLFGLTPAERTLAEAIANGVTLERFAQTRNISLNTARTQLRAIFDKTNLRRQADLVRLALSFAGIDSRKLGL